MYTLSGYGKMISDSPRVAAFSQALRQAVQPGAVVLDIGAGTGYFSVLACRYGAKRVYAIEPAVAINVGKDLAAANGCSDRIQFIQELSTQVELPERVDVIISDLRGILPVFGTHLTSIIDARTRFLSPGGTMIARQDTLRGALIDSPQKYFKELAPWKQLPHEIDLDPLLRFATNLWWREDFTPEELLVEPQVWAVLDYSRIESPDVHGDLKWTIQRAGVGHGCCLWFDSLLADGVGFSNAPGQKLIYGRAFFPWPEPVPLEPGDQVTISLQANLVQQEYVWRWDTEIVSQNGAGRSKASFRQSDFFSNPLCPESLKKRTAGFVPSLAGEGIIDRVILTAMDGKTSLAEIAHRLSVQFPDQFSTPQAALARVGELSSKFST